MASILNYKSPSEKFFSNLERQKQTDLITNAFSSLKKKIESNGDHFSYDIPPFLKERLCSLGVPLHPTPYLSHSHPFSKMLENHILLNVLPAHISGSWMFSSIKKQKVESMATKGKNSVYSTINRLICAKDFGRYDVENDSSVVRSVNCKKKEILPISFINSVKNRNVMIHDEVHHWTLNDMIYFLDSATPKRFVFTVVYPVELLGGIQESQNPKMYTFTNLENGVIYFSPDGKESEGYEQQYDLTWLFLASTITTDNQIYTVKRIYSAYSHHLFEVVPGEFVTDSHRFFNDFETIDLQCIFKSRFLSKDHIPIKKSLVDKIYSYLMCLKKPDMQSAMAKLKQLMGDDVDVRVELFFRSLVSRILSEFDRFKLFDVSVLDKWKKEFLSFSPDWLFHGFSMWKSGNFFDFLMSLDTLRIRIKTQPIDRTFKQGFRKLFDVPKGCQFSEIITSFDKFSMPLSEAIKKRNSKDSLGSTLNLRRPKSKDPRKKYALEICSIDKVDDVLEERRGCDECIGQHSLEIGDETWIKICKENMMVSNLFSKFPLMFIDSDEEVKQGSLLRFFCLCDCPEISTTVFEACGHPMCVNQRNLSARVNTHEDELYMKTLRIHVGKEIIDEILEEAISSLIQRRKQGGKGEEEKASNGLGRHLEVKFQMSDPKTAEGKIDGDEICKGVNSNINSKDETRDDVNTMEFNSILDYTEGGSQENFLDTNETSSFPDLQCTALSPSSCLFSANVCLNKGKKCLEVEVPGDGNCFFSSIIVSAELEKKTSSDLRAMMQMMLEEGGMLELAEQVSDGLWPDDWMIKLFLEKTDISLCVHMHELDGETFCCNPNGRSRRVCVLKRGDHYSGIKFDKCDIPLMSKVDPSSLLAIKEKVLKRNSREIKGRKAFFFSKSEDIDYSHNGIVYRREDWFQELESLIPHAFFFNAALIQIYEKGAKIGFHKDNEICYEGYPIITVNLGEALFEFDSGESFRLCDGDVVTLKGDYLKKKRHRVLALSEGRMSITFRRHFLNMKGSPLEPFSNNVTIGKNKCVLDAVSMALGRTRETVANSIVRKEPELIDCLVSDDLLDMATFENICKICNLRAIVDNEDLGEKVEINSGGGIKAVFSIKDEHMVILSSDDDYRSNFCQKKGLEEFLSPDLKKKIDEETLKFTLDGVEFFQYEVEVERASKLVRNFLSGATGAILNDLVSEGSRYLNFFKNAEKFDGFVEEIGIVCGFAGSGKSWGVISKIKNYAEARIKALTGGRGDISRIKRKEKRFLIISPRKFLAEHWEVKLGSRAMKFARVCTFENFFRMDLKGVTDIFLDEMTLFPNGYLDLAVCRVLCEGRKVNFFAIFDPLQARYDSSSDRGLLDPTHDADKLCGEREVSYLYQSKRFINPDIANLFEDLKGPEVSEEGKTFLKPKVYTNVLTMKYEEEKNGTPIEALLVASFDESGLFSKNFKTMTFGESQGLTVKHVAILLSENSVLADDHRWLVALTRASEKITFVCLHLNGLSGFLSQMENRMIAAVLNKGKVTKARLQAMVRPKLIFKNSENLAGRDEVDREERLEGDLFLKGVIFLGQRVEIEEPEIVEPIEQKENMKTHFFLAQENFAQSINFDNLRAKELREFRINDRVTEQFIDNYEIVQHGQKKHTAGPLRFEAIYPRHRADDDVTFLMAVQKRLKFSNEMKEREKLSRAYGVGSILFQNLIEKFDLNFTWDNDLFDECVNDFEKKKLEKSKAVLANHSIRSDNDWDVNWVLIFMKSQLCTKYEKQYCDAKAGQTLACFQHMILVTFAPYCRYMEKQLREKLPDEIYIHSNKNFNDLNEWVKEFAGDEKCVESDYEAFDASQDHYILAFEVFMMKHMNIPEQIIQGYIDLKVNLGCKLGQFAIMRFTGEFSTFLFNTLANMAFTMCQYEWERGQPIAFAGDDMCALRNLKISNRFEGVLEKISLKAKVQVTEVPMFCGWRLSKFGIVKEPELVYNRFMVALERGNVKECLENYAIEVSYAYSLGERLYDILKKEEQIEYHQSVVRFIVKNISLLKTSVKDLYHEQSGEDSE